MGPLSDRDTAQFQADLQEAVVACSQRGLYHSAKWAAELLNSFSSSSSDGSDTDVDSPMSDPLPHSPTTPLQDAKEAQLEAREQNKFLLARSYFECREFDRCTAVFLPEGAGKDWSSAIGRLSQKALFLALYAKFLAGDKRKDEESEMILGPADSAATTNKELQEITALLEKWYYYADEHDRAGQGWLEYLYGIILAKGKNEELAKKVLLRSVQIYPYNWGAWQELGALLNTVDDLNLIVDSLPTNIMTLIFHVATSQELFQYRDQTHTELSQLQGIFPNSSFLKTQKALLLYHNKEWDEAESIFENLLKSEPRRLDALDTYSNILYVMQKRPRLAFLAQVANATDKFRPETCVVVGNYYSLRSEHEKAVMYFRRALTLDRNFLAAWTLMGHEYMEMKNTHAAIESYRRAVDVNRKDHRAWYGLGQAYEILDMHSYALYYFQRAAALTPYDNKMWQAVGSCMGRVGRVQSAIRAYKRALMAGSYNDVGASSSFGSSQDGLGSGVMDPETLYQIALLYERLHDIEECASYMEMTLAQEDGPDDDEQMTGEKLGTGVTATTSKARMWLAKYEFMNENYQRSMELANELCQDGVEVEDAKALVRDIRARIELKKDSGVRQAVEDVERRFGHST